MASITKREGRARPWQVRYRDPDGQSRRRQFTRRIDAERFRVQVEHQKHTGSYVDPRAGRVTFGEYGQAWLGAQTVDVKTAEGLTSNLRAHLLPAFGGVELRAIRPSTVQQWMAAASRNLAPSYVRLMLSTLSAILGAAVEDGLIVTNPCRTRSVRAPSVPAGRVRPWTVEQVRRAEAALPHRYQATAAVAAGCGLRQGETFGLRVCDVDFLRQRVEVRQQAKYVAGQGVVIAPPKRGKSRTVPLPEMVAVAVAEHLRAFPAEPDGLVFTNTAGGPINRGSFNDRAWKPAVVEAGLEPTRDNGFHVLRHTYASTLLDAGVSIRALADYLGHAEPGFTLRVYTHLMPASEHRARQAVDVAFARVPDVSQEVR